MLAAAARMRRRAEFTAAVRGGRRAGTPALVVHARAGGDEAVQVGFIVGRSVGSAVVRNRVRRRLRHLVRDRFAQLPAGARVVIRANPPAAVLPSSALGDQLDRALHRALDEEYRR